MIGWFSILTFAVAHRLIQMTNVSKDVREVTEDAGTFTSGLGIHLSNMGVVRNPYFVR